MPADDMEDRSEDLSVEQGEALDLEGARREERPMLGAGGERQLTNEPALARHPLGMAQQRRSRVFVDDGTDIRREQTGIADRKLVHRTLEHGENARGDVFLYKENAECRATLARAVESGRDDVGDELFGESRTVGDERVLA